jgi:RAS guanyl-releasing protein 3
VALPDAIEGEMINIRKMAQLSLIIQELEELQNSATPIDVNMDLVNTLRVYLLYKLVKLSIIPKTIQTQLFLL